MMESFVDDSINEPFVFEVQDGIIDIFSMVKEIIAAENQTIIASRFLSTVEAIMEHFADMYPELPIVVGGGVFQNRALMSRLYSRFGEGRFYAQQQTPINDGSIALGQLYYAFHNTKK
jgi:hydrogenase maturation protein HypF